jgi:hypothetical protein
VATAVSVTYMKRNPFTPDIVIGEYPAADAAQVVAAVDAAQSMTAEMGKPSARLEARRCAPRRLLRYAAGTAFRAVAQEFEQAGGGRSPVSSALVGMP